MTPDHEIASVADRDFAVVITKDADFVDSHLRAGKLAKLLLVSTGNIANREPLRLFEAHLKNIVSAMEASSFVEITASGLILHD